MGNKNFSFSVHPFFAVSLFTALRLGITREAMCGSQIGFDDIRSNHPLQDLKGEIYSFIPEEVFLFKETTFTEFGILQSKYPKSTWSCHFELTDDSWRSRQEYQFTLRLDDEESNTHMCWKVWEGLELYDEEEKKKAFAAIDKIRNFVEENSGLDNVQKDEGYIKA